MRKAWIGVRCQTKDNEIHNRYMLTSRVGPMVIRCIGTRHQNLHFKLSSKVNEHRTDQRGSVQS